MAEVVSVKFRNKGKCYFFDPVGKEIPAGVKVIVETSRGLEIVDCCRGTHYVPDEAVVPPLRPVIRVADRNDLRVDEMNRRNEAEAMKICRRKIEDHKLDMKLVDAECSFDGSKTTFYFTSDGRVDFRELVRDLASVFHNRIELRQIGVRDEAKMVGGIGICGRPYCCNQFLEDFAPVSTKMAKIQSLSLNPTKISGSCGRLMCCLRYEEEAYEELTKKVPKQGAFVETKDGFGTAVQVNLLRQTVKVRLDEDTGENLHLYKANELCAVPGGRPKDGSTPPSTFVYVPEEPEEMEEPANPAAEWTPPLWKEVEETEAEEASTAESAVSGTSSGRRSRHQKKKNAAKADRPESERSAAADAAAPAENPKSTSAPAGETGEAETGEAGSPTSGRNRKHRSNGKNKTNHPAPNHSAAVEENTTAAAAIPRSEKPRRRKPEAAPADAAATGDAPAQQAVSEGKKRPVHFNPRGQRRGNRSAGTGGESLADGAQMQPKSAASREKAAAPAATSGTEPAGGTAVRPKKKNYYYHHRPKKQG